MPELAEETIAETVMITPFGIEFDHPRNCDMVVQSIPGCKCRSAIRADRVVVDAKTGRSRIPADQANSLGRFPPIPGQQLHVNAMKLSYNITDPLCDNPALREELRKGLAENTPFTTGNLLGGVPKQEGTLDQHAMKTLVREMINMVKSGEAKVCRGELPSQGDCDKLPGHYLLNPGSRVGNSQPTFEKDFPAWRENLTLHGG